MSRSRAGARVMGPGPGAWADAVIKQARNYDIALTPKQVKVSRVGGFGIGTLAIEAEYSVPVELPGFSTTLSFHPSSQNKGVY